MRLGLRRHGTPESAAPAQNTETADDDVDPPAAISADPSASLEALANANWSVRPLHRLQGLHYVQPKPLRPGLHFMIEPGKNDMFIWKMDLGDPALERRGIGSLLMLKSVQYVLECENENIETVSRNQGTMGLVGVMQRLFGEKNVSWDVPEHLIGDSDVIFNVTAEIEDPDRIMSIDFERHLGQLASTGHAWPPGRSA